VALHIYCRILTLWATDCYRQITSLYAFGLYAKAAKEKGNFPLNIEAHSLFQILFTHADFQLLAS